MDAPQEVNGWDAVLAQAKKQPGAMFDPQKGFIDPSTLPAPPAPSAPPVGQPPSWLAGPMGYLNGEKLPPEMGGGNWQAIRQQALGGPAFNRVGNDWYQEGATPGPLTFGGAQAAGAAAMAPRETGGPGDSGYMSFNQMANLVGHDIRMFPAVAEMYGQQQQRRQLAETEAGKLDIERQKVAALTDPRKLMAQSYANTAGEILKRGGPNVQNELAALHENYGQMMESDQFQKIAGRAPGGMGGGYQPGGPSPTGSMTPEQMASYKATGQLPPQSLPASLPDAPPRSMLDIIAQQKAKYGPEIGGALSEFKSAGGDYPTPTPQLMRNIFLRDQAEPGYMEKFGPGIMAAIAKNRGPEAVNEYASLGFGDFLRNLPGVSWFGNRENTDWLTRSAIRHYNRDPYTNTFLGQPDFATSTAPPIPGSPALDSPAVREATRAAALRAFSAQPVPPAPVAPIRAANMPDRRRLR